MEGMGNPQMELAAVTIDCSDAAKLADFYARLTGGEVTYSDADQGYGQTQFGGADDRRNTEMARVAHQGHFVQVDRQSGGQDMG